MYISASSREYPTYDDYVKSGVFSPEQLHWIRKGFDVNLSPRDVALYAQPDFSADQMEEIYDGFNCEMDFRDILLYANPEFNAYQMNEIKMGLWSYELDRSLVAVYANPRYDDMQMNVIRNILFSHDNYNPGRLESLLDTICHPEYSIQKIKTLYYLWEFDAAQEIIDYVKGLELNDQAMYWIKRGFESGLSIEQVQSYAKPDVSNEWMRDRFYSICNSR